MLGINDSLKVHHEIYVANKLLSEVILGLDWLIDNPVIVNTANMLLKFPESDCKPFKLASIKDPIGVVLG